MSNEKIGLGATFERSTDGSTFTRITNVISGAAPTVTRDYNETTSFDSGGFKEYVPSFKDSGSVTLECNYINDAFDTMKADEATGNAIHYRVTLPMEDGKTKAATVLFKGYPTVSIGIGNVKDTLTYSVEIKVDGATTYVAAS